MRETDSKPTSNEEFDLTNFFQWIGKGFNRIGNNILYVLASLRNIFILNRIFFSVLILLGIILGLIYIFQIRKKTYTTTMVLSCDYLNAQIIGNTVRKLNLLCNEPSRKGLAAELGVSDSIVQNVEGFDAVPFVSETEIVEMEVLKEQLNNLAVGKQELVNNVINKLNIENKRAYQITMHISKPAIVSTMEEALVHYFLNNPYVKRRVEIAGKNRLKRKEKLILESRKLDSLKATILQHLTNLEKSSKGSNNVILNDDKLNNPLDVFKEDLLINQQILDLEKDIYLMPDFEVIDGFTISTQPSNTKPITVLLICVLLAILNGYIILLLIRFDRILAKYPTN